MNVYTWCIKVKALNPEPTRCGTLRMKSLGAPGPLFPHSYQFPKWFKGLDSKKPNEDREKAERGFQPGAMKYARRTGVETGLFRNITQPVRCTSLSHGRLHLDLNFMYKSLSS
jgi:hypothetical protein